MSVGFGYCTMAGSRADRRLEYSVRDNEVIERDHDEVEVVASLASKGATRDHLDRVTEMLARASPTPADGIASRATVNREGSIPFS